MAFSIDLTPRGKGRPISTIRKLKGGGVRAGAYTPASTRDYEALVKAAAEKVMGSRAPAWQALSVFLKFRIPVPVSYSKKERAAILSGDANYYGAFDIDNLLKSILDGFNSVAFDDDRQVCQAVIVRIANASPGIDVRISEFNPKDWI